MIVKAILMERNVFFEDFPPGDFINNKKKRSELSPL